MNDSKIPVRYAKALLELAIENKMTEKVYKDLLIIQELVRITDVKEILQSPVIPSGKKNKIFNCIIPTEINEMIRSFIDMVFQNKREIYIEGIIRDFISSYKKFNNIKTVEITTAIKIDQAQEEKFKKQVLENIKANIELETITDSTIIGGFIIRIDDQLFDASIKRQLKNVQNSLLQEKI